MTEKYVENTNEEEKDYISFGKALGALGQPQYVTRPLTNVFPDEYPFLGEGIRYIGSYDMYQFIKIHKDDVLEYASRYIAYKNETSPIKINKEEKLKEIEMALV